MKQLALLGASGHGKVIADAALLSDWQSVTFFDDAWPTVRSNGHWAVEGNTATLLARQAEFDGVIVAIGDCKIRWDKQQLLQAAGTHIATVIHPAAMVSAYARIGAGTVVMAGAVVNVDAVLGNACIVNTGATVDHDCQLANGVHISPGAHLSGNVQVGDCSWVGVGAAVRQGVVIGDHAMVGAGAVVVRSIATGLTVVGSPAMSLTRR